MSIVKTITDDYEFAIWLKNSGSYKNNFSFEGANALQEYLEDLSDDMGENIEFDPIAWCCGYSEYENFEDFKKSNGWTDSEGDHEGYEEIKTLEDLYDHTSVVEFDGGIIIQDF